LRAMLPSYTHGNKERRDVRSGKKGREDEERWDWQTWEEGRKEKKGLRERRKERGETYEFLLIIANPATTVDAELNLYTRHEKENIVSENEMCTREKWIIAEDKDSFQAFRRTF
jgi:hypothetical protein